MSPMWQFPTLISNQNLFYSKTLGNGLGKCRMSKRHRKTGFESHYRPYTVFGHCAAQRLQLNEPFSGCIGGHEIPLILPKIFKKYLKNH